MIDLMNLEYIMIGEEKINSEDIMMQGLNLKYSIDGDDAIKIGGVASGSLNITIKRKGNDGLRGESVFLYIDKKKYGPFVIEQARNVVGADAIRIEAFDKVRGMIKKVNPDIIPQKESVGYILKELLGSEGVELETQVFLNSGFVVEVERDDLIGFSVRDIVGQVLAFSGSVGYINPSTGKFKVKSILKAMNEKKPVNSNVLKTAILDEKRKKTGVAYYRSFDDVIYSGSLDDPLILDFNVFINSLKDDSDFIDYLGSMYNGIIEYSEGDVALYKGQDLFIGDVLLIGNDSIYVSDLTLKRGLLDIRSNGYSVVDIEGVKAENVRGRWNRNAKI